MTNNDTVTTARSGTTHGPAVLDDAHVGDIRGALGRIAQQDMAPRRGWKARLLTLAAIMGPGLIVMVGDNDAGGVATYAQAGQNYGTSLLWTLPLLIPVLIVNQEMVVRLGAVTGVGHGRLIFERFGRFWGAFAVGDLFLLNFLTIVTEFIGVSLACRYFGLSPYYTVPIAGAMLVGITVTGRFERWERFMFLFLLLNALVIPIAFLSHPDVGRVAHDLAVPGIRGGVSSDAILLIIAIVGTTVAPWQLFFQQSNVVDKRITPRWIGYERTDTVIGALVVVTGAIALMLAPAFVLGGTPAAGQFSDAGGVAGALGDHNRVLGTLFAIVLLDASIIGASAVTLATSYAFGDVFGIHHSLHRPWREAKAFYASFAGTVVLAAAIVLLPGAPLGLITTGVQALAGVLLPSASVFLLLLCNDRAVLGPWVNRPWLNAIASLILGVLLMLSLILVVTTLVPQINVGALVLGSGATLAAALVAVGVWSLRGRRATAWLVAGAGVDKLSWRMPPLALLDRPAWSRTRLVGMWSLRVYLVIAVVLLLVKAVQIGTGH